MALNPQFVTIAELAKTISCCHCSLARRTCHDVLELVEVCLDFDLQGNQLRVRFNGSPIVSVSVQETSRDVVFLITTANSVHRLAFTHPALLHSRVSKTLSLDQ